MVFSLIFMTNGQLSAPAGLAGAAHPAVSGARNQVISGKMRKIGKKVAPSA